MFPFIGVAHGMELLFVFALQNGTYPFLGQNLPIVLTPEERDLSVSIVNNWVNFITSGIPNPVWPLYEQSSDMNWNFDLKQTVDSGLKREKCDYWETINLLKNPMG